MQLLQRRFRSPHDRLTTGQVMIGLFDPARPAAPGLTASVSTRCGAVAGQLAQVVPRRVSALEWLWRTGQIAVTRRDGFAKIYDLCERVIPEAHRGPVPADQITHWPAALRWTIWALRPWVRTLPTGTLSGRTPQGTGAATAGKGMPGRSPSRALPRRRLPQPLLPQSRPWRTASGPQAKSHPRWPDAAS